MQITPVSFVSHDQCLSKRKVITRTRTNKKQATIATASPVVRDSITVAQYPTLVETWLATGEIESHSPLTLSSRRERTGRLLWYCQREGYEKIGITELRAFFAYLVRSHESPQGRWDNPRCKQPLAPGRVKAFHSSFRTFFHFLEDEGVLDAAQSPMRRIKAPVDRPDQITPFSEDDCLKLLSAAKNTNNPYRDTAVLSILLDCGLRAAELCSLTVADALLDKGVVVVRLGKGGKKRSVPMSAFAKRAIFEYIQRERGTAQEESEPLFLSSRGITAGDAFTTNGLSQLFDRLGKESGVSGVRVSPHTCRHTFAVTFLRAGGNSLALQTMLGHESLTMTQNYVKIAEADMTIVAL